jgi:uncharacterized protein YPO0396
MDEIEQLLDQLKEAREESAAARKSKQAIIEAAQETTEYQRADEATNAADELITRLEAKIKQQALDLHELCAALPERVAVKMFTVVNVPDELKAKDWCIAHFTPALKLDGKVFEKAAKDGNIPAELATVSKEPRAQIATKL